MKQKVILTILSVFTAAAIAGCGAKSAMDENAVSNNQNAENESVHMEDITVTDTSDDSGRLALMDSEEENTDFTDADLPEETADLTFADLAELEFEFSSGAGGWSEGFAIEKDGSFSGNFHDSDMGVTSEGYPDGTMYCSSYTGHFTELNKINDYTYEMKLADISYKDTVGTDEICDGMHFIYTESYCLGGNDTFKVYLPGTPLSELSEEECLWISYNNESETELTMIVIVDEKNEYGIYSYPRPDPLEDARMTFNTYKDSYDYYVDKLSEAETTVEMAEYAETMYENCDSCLNYIWNLVKNNVEEDKFNEILEEQREWIAQKEARAEEIISEGGSMAAVDCNQFMAELTMERCEKLIGYLD